MRYLFLLLLLLLAGCASNKSELKGRATTNSNGVYTAEIELSIKY